MERGGPRSTAICCQRSCRFPLGFPPLRLEAGWPTFTGQKSKRPLGQAQPKEAVAVVSDPLGNMLGMDQTSLASRVSELRGRG